MGQNELVMRAELREIAFYWADEGQTADDAIVSHVGWVEGGWQSWMEMSNLDSTVHIWFDTRGELLDVKVGDDIGDSAVIARIEDDIIMREESFAVCNFDPNTEVAFVWSVQDVWERRKDLSLEDAMTVLTQCKSKHDAEVGMNWSVIDAHADDLFPNDDYDDDDYELDPTKSDGSYRKIGSGRENTRFVCPECGSRDLDEPEPTQFESEQITRIMKCNEDGCGTVFEVHYEQVRIERR